MRVRSIASGSSGNSIYMGTDNTHILIDAGISGKRITSALEEMQITGNDINALFITHEHIDHIKGVGVICRKFGIPVYATYETINEIRNNKSVGKIDESLFNVVFPDTEINIGDIKVTAFNTSHDAVNPVGYRLSAGDKSAALVTDLGEYDDYIVSNLQNLDAIFIEANHDIRMLQTGPYSYELKRRIMGARGHLSNEDGGRLLSRILHDNMKHVILSHLSHENNYPHLAYEAVRMEVTMADNKYHGDDFDIRVASRDLPSDILYI